jgi:hypothetical protein
MEEKQETMKDVFEQAIAKLETNLVLDHIKAAAMVHLELTMIEGFDKDIINALGLYQTYLQHKHQSIKFVGMLSKIKGMLIARGERSVIKELINRCERKTFGNGDAYIKKIIFLIRKAL